MTIVSRVVNKLTTTFKRYLSNCLCCYSIKANNYEYKISFPICTISSLEELSKIECENDFVAVAKIRISAGHQLVCCCDNNRIIASGWHAKDVSNFYAWEIAGDIKFHNPVDVLYDFYVKPTYRGKGIYQSLLHFIINNSMADKVLVIYAEKSNKISNLAILKCGFHILTTITHFNNCML